MSLSWDKISAGRVLDMAEAKHLQVHDDAGNLVPAMRRGSTRVLGAARGLDADAARVHRRRLSSLEESRAAVSKHVERAKAGGAYYELEFAEPRLGFTVALARHHAASASPRSPRAELVHAQRRGHERETLRSRLRPRDEVVTLAGQAVAIRDDDGYDDAQRYAAFGRIKAQIRDAPRPVTLGFVEGAGRDAAFAECLKRRELAAEDKARARAATAAAGAALRTAADDALRDCEDMARAADAPRPTSAACDAARLAAKLAALVGGADAPDAVRRAYQKKREAAARGGAAALLRGGRGAIREWARAIVGADGRDAVDWAGAAAALFPGRGVDAAQIAECHRRRASRRRR
ncbi:hypothetical protein JL722_5268 [Aureococcus anophagefferens]|nr:hypothetical protein JL722_5268 [Aureococcus anophagefferens]